MSSILALFPLNIVVFPGEEVKLHIFEKRYQQLVLDCMDQSFTFGIPTIRKDKELDYGTEVKLDRIIDRFDDGKIDIQLKGIRRFQTLDFYPVLHDRLYPGGEIQFSEQYEGSDEETTVEIIGLVQEMYDIMGIDKDVGFTKDEVVSYKLGHIIGLNKEQEYELLTMDSEAKRQDMIVNHLKRIIPIVQEMEDMRQRVQMNGHFKHFTQF